MKKGEVSEVLLHLWGCVDQADYDSEIKKAFKACPIKVQKELIETILGNPELWIIDPDEDTLHQAKRLIGTIE